MPPKKVFLFYLGFCFKERVYLTTLDEPMLSIEKQILQSNSVTCNLFISRWMAGNISKTCKSEHVNKLINTQICIQWFIPHFLITSPIIRNITQKDLCLIDFLLFIQSNFSWLKMRTKMFQFCQIFG